MPINQRPDNSFSVILSPKEWVKHEYDAGRGSMFHINELARKYKLLHDLKKDPAVTIAMYAAWEFLLGVTLD